MPLHPIQPLIDVPGSGGERNPNRKVSKLTNRSHHQRNNLRTEKCRIFLRAKIPVQQQGIIEQVLELRSGTGLGTQRFVVNDHTGTVLLGHIFRILFYQRTEAYQSPPLRRRNTCQASGLGKRMKVASVSVLNPRDSPPHYHHIRNE
ncbi:hypothetical protein TNCV_2156511 [Trichonephila clavipes]|nr:hypothetical protein TNCV_2156511 [Trichonephila clavipes]